MHSLFSDRFLRLFAGNLQHRPQRTIPNVKDQNPEAKAEATDEPVDPASEEGHEKNVADGNHLPNVEEQNKKNDLTDKMSKIG